MSYVSFVFRRYLKIRNQGRLVKLITILATTGVALGVTVLFVAIAVMTGIQSELGKRIQDIDAHATVRKMNGWMTNDRQLIDKIENIKDVLSASPVLYSQAMVQSAHSVAGIFIRAMDFDTYRAQTNKIAGMELSTYFRNESQGTQRNSIVIGNVMADKLKVGVGDDVMLMVAGGRSPNSQQVPKRYRARVTGIFDTGMYQYDSTIGFMHLDYLQQILNVESAISGIEVRVAHPGLIEDTGNVIATTIGSNFMVRDWRQINRPLFASLLLQKLVMYIILTLIIFVAAFNIASALIMMVNEKTRDIAILKTMGATRSSLQKVFLGKGMVIGGIGLLIGLSTGAIICWLLSQYQFVTLPGDVYFLTFLPVKLEVRDIVIIVLGTLGICFFASLYPARKASRMEAVDGIRYG